MGKEMLIASVEIIDILVANMCVLILEVKWRRDIVNFKSYKTSMLLIAAKDKRTKRQLIVWNISVSATYSFQQWKKDAPYWNLT
jgi:hypothetical protein